MSVGSVIILLASARAETGFSAWTTADVDALRPALRDSWEEAAGRCTWSETPNADSPRCQSESLLTALRLVYRGPEESGAFLDVGAYVGHWTAEVLSKFGKLEHKKFAKEFGSESSDCHLPGNAVSIYCLEPVKASYNRLSDRAKRSAWLLEDVQFMRAGVANATGKASLWVSSGGAPDAKASMSPREGAEETVEKMVTIDLLLKKTVKQNKAFLVRLAVNGYEHRALQGAKKSLKNGTINFILFEMSPLWKDAGHSLKDSIKLLWKAGFACFALLNRPVPLSGPFWQERDVASGPAWFQVFCGANSDTDFHRVLRVLDVDGPAYF